MLWRHIIYNMNLSSCYFGTILMQPMTSLKEQSTNLLSMN